MPRYPEDPRPPQANELAKLASDVRYEIVHFRYAAKTAMGLPDPSRERNVCLEAMGLHLRCLVNFFMNERRKPDDVLARHFSPGWSASSDGGPELDWLDGLRDFTNKRLAHLTTARVRVPKARDTEKILEILDNMEIVIGRFRRRPDLKYQGTIFPPTLTD